MLSVKSSAAITVTHKSTASRLIASDSRFTLAKSACVRRCNLADLVSDI